MAGKVTDIEDVSKTIQRLLEDWIFVDIGFAPKSKSCGIAIGNGEAKEVKIAKPMKMAVEKVERPGSPLNLPLQAPLSMVFTKTAILSPGALNLNENNGTPCRNGSKI